MATGKTPAQMIMVGILQIRDSYNKAFHNKEYYNASRFLQNMYFTLPMEAQKEYALPEPPALEEGALNITPDDSERCRNYCDEHAPRVHQLVPKYVYGYFERGKRLLQGY